MKRVMKMKSWVALLRQTVLVLPLLCSLTLIAQVSITSTTTVTENFDGLGATSTASLPTGFRVTNGSTTAYSSGTTATTQAAGTSGTGALTGSSTGGTYNFASGVTGSSSERSVGFITSGGFASPGYLYVQITNNGSATITDLSLSFDYEKYRAGTRAWTMAMQTSSDGSSWSSDVSGSTQSYSADGANAVVNPPTTTSKSVSLTGLSISVGSSIYLRWSFTGTGGSTNAQGIGLDNFSVTATFASSGCTGTPSHATSSATSTTICSGSTATLSITGFSSGTGYTYQWQSASSAGGTYSTITGATNTTYTTSALTTATYYRCITTCTTASTYDTSSVTGITINPLPSPTIAGTATITIGASANLTFSGANSDVVYYWNGSATLSTTLSGAGTSIVTVTPTSTTTYSITSATSSAGCSQSITGQFARITITGSSSTDTIPTRDNNLELGNPSSATSATTDSNNYLMVKSQYALSYNNNKGIANWISWHLSRAWKGSATRCDCFTQDSRLPSGYFRASTGDYTSTGFDRGHLVPSDDRDGSDTDNAATFLMTNITPQAPFLNQQPWENLETYCRNLIGQGYEMYIVSGTHGTGGSGSSGGTTTSISGGDITVPSHVWKVVVALPVGINDLTRISANTRVFAVDVPNQQSVSSDAWESYKVSVDSIETLTGYNIMSSVSSTVQNAIESKAEVTLAGWDFNAVTSSVTSMTATAVHPNMDPSTASSLNTITRGSSASAVSSSGTFATAGFGNDGISTANNDYYQVKVKGAAGYTVSITGLDLAFGGTSSYYASAGVTSQIAYSLDGTTFTLIGSPITTSSLGPVYFDCSGVSALQNLSSSTTVFLRYYASGQTSGGTWGLRSVDTGIYGIAVIGRLDAAGCTGTPSAATATATPSSICSGGTSALALSGHSTGSSFTYQWQSSTTGAVGSFSNITGATNTTYTTGALSADTYYRCITTCSVSALSDSSAVDTVLISGSSLPTVGDITGTLSVSSGSTTTLASTTTGGVWTSSNTSIASVDVSTGIVSGISAGTANITYTVTNVCGSAFDTAVVAVTSAYSGPGAVIADTAWAGMTAASAAGSSTFATVPAGTTPGSSVVNVSQWNRSVVVSTTGTGYYNTLGWTLGSVVDSAIAQRKFAYFTITNNGTTQVKLTKLNIKGQRSGTGPASAQARYIVAGSSTESDFGSVATVPTTAGDIAFTGDLCIAPGATDTIKVYGFAATGTGGTFRITNGSYINAVYATVASALSITSSTNSSPVCVGSSISFTGGTASGGLTPYSYSWSGPASFASTLQNPTIASAALTDDGTFNYTVTDSLGCTIANSTVASVSVSGGSVTVTPSSSSICTGGSDVLTASGATTYSWSPSTGLSATTGSIVTASPSSTTTYTVTGTSSCGTSTQTVTVTVSGTVTPSVTTMVAPSDSVCASTPVTFTASAVNGGSTPGYQWFNSSAAISGATDSVYTYTPTDGDTIVCTMTSSLACASPASATSAIIVMTVTPVSTIMVADITGTLAVTTGSTTTLASTTAGGTWSSSNAAIASVDSASGVVTGLSTGSAIISYLVTGTCSSGFDTALVSVTPVAGSSSSIADTAWAGMTAGSAAGSSTFATVPAGTTPGSSVVNVSQWNRSVVGNNSGTGFYNTNGWTTGSIVDSAIEQSKFVYFTITNNSTTEVKLTKLNIKGQRSSTGPANAQARYKAGGSGTESDFGSVATVPTGAGDIAFTGNVCIAPGVTDTIKVYGYGASSSTGTFRVANGTYINAIYTTVTSALAITASTNSSPVCTSSAFSFTGGTASGGSGAYAYSWSGPAAYSSTDQSPLVSSASLSSAGVYTYSVTDAIGCVVSNTTSVTVDAVGAGLTVTPSSSTICTGDSVALTASGGGTYSWSPSTGVSATMGASVTASPSITTTYTVTGTSSCGTSTQTVTVNVSGTVTPSVTTVVTPIGAVCAGTPVSFTASVVNGGATPGYQWYNNSAAISGATDSVYTYSPTNGDTVVCTLTSSVACASPSTATSSIIVMTVTPVTTIIVAAITGTSTVTTGSTTTLASTTGGGTWSSSNISIASVDSTSGVVTGVAVGGTIITYAVSGTCASGFDTAIITVTPLPGAGSSISDTAWAGMTAASATGSSSFATLPAGTTPGSSVVNVSQWGRGNVTNNSGTGFYNSTNWSTSTLVDSAVEQRKFVYFTITNNSTTEVKLTKLNIIGQRSTSGPASANARYIVAGSGVESDFGSTASVPTSAGNIAFTGSLCIAPGVTDTIKVYGYGATSTTGTFRVANGTYINAVYTTVTSALAITSSTNSSPVTSGSSVSFTGGTPSGGVTPYAYSWSGPAAFVSTVQNPTIASATATEAGSYNYQVADAFGCFVANSTSVTVTSTGSASVTVTPTSAVICTGDSTILTASGAASYTWAPTTGLSASTGSAVTAYPAVTTIYTVTEAGGASTTVTVTVVTSPTAGSLSGADTVAAGYAIALTPSITGGTWSSSNIAIATVNSLGLVTGIATGSATISYAISSSCGMATATKNITVITVTAATLGAITGTTLICSGTTSTLSNTTAGGTWTTSNASVASVNASGTLYGVAAGVATITYTVSGVGFATTSVTVTTTPTAGGAIGGPTAVCIGSSITLTDSLPGGIWGTTNPTVGSISSTGVVSGLSAGTAGIFYILFNACGIAYHTTSITVASPSVASIIGTTVTCPGNSVTLGCTTAGGVWSTSSSSVASISASGVVTGVAAGTATISYSITNACGVNSSSVTFTVSSPGTMTDITGATTVCQGAATTYSNATAGGTWVSADSTIARVNSSGVITGISSGSTSIIYYITTSCGVLLSSKTITVLPIPDTVSISGTSLVCVGSSYIFSTTGTGGTWSNVPTTRASISATGILTGLATGADTVYYIITNSCGTSISKYIISVDDVPTTAGTLSGVSSLNIGASATMVASIIGGTWSVTSPTRATINSSGVITGNASGSNSVIYTVSNTCGSYSATKTVTITGDSLAGAISGPSSVCIGSTVTLSSSTSGGTWSSSSSTIASITSGGVVRGNSSGTVIITYTRGSLRSNYTVYVNSPSVNAISGVAFVCPGVPTLITNITVGGTWRNLYPYVGAIDSITGIYTGISAGNDSIIYTVVNACGTRSVRKNISVGGAPTVNVTSFVSGSFCVGTSAVFTNASTGIWSIDDTSIARISAVSSPSVTVTGRGLGITTLRYTVTNSCGLTAFASTPITITSFPSVSAIAGATSVGVGSSITLTDSVMGGVWSTSNSSMASVNATGVVTGLLEGSATISYAVTNGCGTAVATLPITVTAIAISGSSAVCIGSTITLTASATGGTWSSSSTARATVSSGGVVTGVSTGSVTITYALGAARAYYAITVNTSSVNAISGATSVCPGVSTTLTNLTTGGTWSNVFPALGTINASTGVYTGISSGTDSVIYTVVNACGTRRVRRAQTVSSLPPAAGTISGASSVVVGATITLTSSVSGGTWSNVNTTISSVTTAGVVRGLSAGVDTIKYRRAYTCGATIATKVITVVASKQGESAIAEATTAIINVYPNPSTGLVMVEATANISKVYVYDLTGKLLEEVNSNTAKTAISLVNYASGTYLLRIITESGMGEVKVIKE